LAHPSLWVLGAWRWFKAEEMARLARDSGLIVCTEVYGPNLPNVPVSISNVKDMVGMFEVAKIMGSPLVVITGRRSNTDDPKALDNCVDFLKELDKRIANYPGIRLALEPHYGSSLQKREDFRYIFDRVDSPRIGITVDTGHFHSAEVDTIAFIKEFGSKVLNIHLKDHVGKQSVPIGEGEIDLKGIVKALDGIGYEGALAIEIEPKDPEKLPGYAKDSYWYMRKIVKEVTGQET
jgi:sugar phosphate isomerase/epimerase